MQPLCDRVTTLRDGRVPVPWKMPAWSASSFAPVENEPLAWFAGRVSQSGRH